MYVDLENHLGNLPVLVAKSHDSSDVLETSLDTIIHEQEICCGRDSALEDSVEKADPLSLKDVALKLQGRHLLGDGRPIFVTTEFWPTETADPVRIVNAIKANHGLLMVWNSHLYVVYAIVYRWVDSGVYMAPLCVIRSLQLIDTRFSDQRRTVEYNHETDDPAKVQGFLTVSFSVP